MTEKIISMKNIITFLITFFFISCNKSEQLKEYLVFSGEIENLKGEIISVRNDLTNTTQLIKIQEDGKFLDTLNNIESGYYTVRHGNETTGIYLKPGYQLDLLLNTKEFDESILYSGIGSLENNYLAQEYLRNERLSQIKSYKYLATLTEKEYVHKTDSIKKLEMDFLNDQKGLDPEFKTLEKASIYYSWVNQLKNYTLIKEFVNKETDIKVSENFPDFEKDLDLEDENLLDVYNYRTYLKSHYSKRAFQLAQKDKMDINLAFLKTVSSEVKSDKIKEQLLYEATKYGIANTGKLQKYYQTFMDNSTDEDHKNDITEKYKKLIKLTKGKSSPKFVDYENFEGGHTSLDDLKGKYVYIDVWATWCGPCKREIPALKEVEKKYRKQNIEFVSMSIDRKIDYNKWRTAVNELNLSGIQLFAPDDWNSKFVTDYEIRGIPRFILIDPEGNIVNSNAPRPSSEELITLLDDLKI